MREFAGVQYAFCDDHVLCFEVIDKLRVKLNSKHYILLLIVERAN